MNLLVINTLSRGQQICGGVCTSIVLIAPRTPVAIKVQSNLFKWDLVKRDFGLSGTPPFASLILCPYKSRRLRGILL
jgi:hypothetical protein